MTDLDQDEHKVLDVLSLMRRWEKQLKALPEFERKLVLDYLNEKCGK